MEVDESRKPILFDRVSTMLDILEHHFPIAPFYTVYITANINDKAFTVGLSLLTQEKISLIHAINDTISWHLTADPFCDCWK